MVRELWHRHWMGVGMIYWLVILGVLSYFMWLYFRPRRPTYSVEDPLEIAKRRLARGEITPEEYEDIKRKLYEGR
jgi:putative membrane protein